MSKMWDDKMKRLFGIKPQDYVQWLLPEATFVDTVSLELKTVTRTISADILCEVLIDGKKALVHIEIQRRLDSDMAERVWEYNVLATLANKCPVYSFVIYLLPHGKIPESPLVVGLPQYEAVHIFRFTNIKLSELMVEDIRKYNLKGILPLCLLTKNGARHEVGDKILEELAASTEKKDRELLNLAFGLASLVFTSEADIKWLERKFDMLEEILKDTWYERRLLRKGREEGREETLRFIILEIVQTHFPAIMEFAKQQVDQIHASVDLQKLSSRLIMAQNQEEAMQAFQDLNHKP